MRRRVLLKAAVVAAAAATVPLGGRAVASAASPTAAAVAALRADLARLPAGWQSRLAARLKAMGWTSPWSRYVSAATGQAGTCSQPTGIGDYIDSTLKGADGEVVNAIGMAGGFVLPFVDVIEFATDATPRTFGVNGEYTTTLTHAFRDVKRFWDIASDDILFVPMHGADVFGDERRTARSLALLYGVSESEALPIARDLRTLLALEPRLDGGRNPLFSFNAVAVPTYPGSDRPKLIMGDGIMQAMTWLGLGDIAPRSIMAHEFGHHVQFEDGIEFGGDVASGRRAELMADALGTYFLVHARGQALNTKRTLDTARSFYEVGDCYTEEFGHHGTPAQRMAASRWAADVANEARPQGAIQPSRSFVARFDAALPGILAAT
ncbi:hypothetical protein R8Z50_23885 [Longispora sp. K20-0274]|uniref:hypothetical protein n=1 Tax=Longispora sp. K20-0274 TaxID=3088255 RepID=UPI00399A3512